MSEIFDIEEVIRILGLEIRAEQADEGRNFDVACRVALNKLQKCKKYEELEEQGLLLRLPCKIGDTVYVKLASYCEKEYAEATVRDFTHFISCGFCVVVTSEHFNKQNIPFTEFGKTVFLTKSEAIRS